MYLDHFNLNENPFSLTPDPRYLFMSERHREGLAHLLYGVQQPGGFVQLTGDIGSGKTTLCRCLIKQLPSDTEVALVLNPRLTVIELLATVCDELRIPYPAETGSIKVLIDALNRHLLEAHAQGRRTVLIIDEAQNLNEDVLEQIRLLTNLETSQDKLLQIILIGQPELLSLLSGRKLRQLAQRITARYHLLALSKSETCAYIQHRLKIAGRRDPLFTDRAMRCVYRLSGGMPRLINIICDRALLGAYARDKRRINSAIVRTARRETQGRVPRHRKLRLAWAFGIAMTAFLVIAGILFVSPALRSMLIRDSWGVASNAQSLPVGIEAIRGIDGEAKEEDGIPDSTKEVSAKLEQPLVPGESASDGNSVNLRLADILANPDLRGRASSTFASLYALWGVQFPANSSEPACQAGETQGFECLFQVGNWPKLRRFNLPAVLETVLPNGERNRVALIRLGKDSATLAIGGRRYTFPLLEINEVWDGSFILIWKPPFTPGQLSSGSRGEAVQWVRKALDSLDGTADSSEVSDLYDETLRQRILAFQREQSLIPDGYVGPETLARLTVVLEGPDAPVLMRNDR
jgi:general secretion pathway protein A